MMHRYLACFDITDDHSRYKVGVLLEAYGMRVQRSVFEISLRTEDELVLLQNRLVQYLDTDDDLRFYHLCVDCCSRSLNALDGTIAAFPLVVVL